MFNIKYLYLNDKKRLHFIFLKNLTNKNEFIRFISMNYNKSDEDLFKIINDRFVFEKICGSVRIDNIKKILPDKIHAKKYLDVGCHKGDITKAIADYFEIELSNIFGIDIKKYCDMPFNFKIFDTKTNILFDDNTFDLITCFMVLHHSVNSNNLIKEIYRVMNPGGILIIKEHDCASKEDKVTLDILHEFYDKILYKDEEDDQNTIWHTSYQAEIYWTKKFIDNGFKLLKPVFIKNQVINPLRNYISVFIKK